MDWYEVASLLFGAFCVAILGIPVATTRYRNPRMRRPTFLVPGLGALLLGALTFAGCAKVASPRGWMPPIAWDSFLLVSRKTGEVSLINIEDGTPVWRFPTDNDVRPIAFYARPVATQDRVYVGGYDGNVYALDKRDGRLAWTFKAGSSVIGGLALEEVTQSLLVPTDDGRLYALDLASGEVRPGWPFRSEKGIWGAPLAQGNTVYVGSLDGKVYAIDAASGAERWHVDLGTGVISDPVLAGGLLLLGATDRRLHAIDVASGRLAWSTSWRAGNWFWAKPFVQGETVYAANLDGRLYALGLADGALKWIFEGEDAQPVRSHPVVVEGVLVVVARDGKVYGLEPETGQKRWGPLALDEEVLADPLVKGGHVILVTRQGQIFRVDPGKGQVEAIAVR